MKNLGADLKDGEALSILLTNISPGMCEACTEPAGSEARASHIIRNAKVRFPFLRWVTESTLFWREVDVSSWRRIVFMPR